MDISKIDEGHPDYKETGEKEPFHYYYNREERIKNAPQIVKDFYDGKLTPKKGLFRCLVATRGNRFMLSSILIFAAFILIFNFLSSRNLTKIAGTQAGLQAFVFEDSVYASFKMEKLEDFADSLPVKVHFEAVDSSGTVSDVQELTDNYTGQELFVRTKFGDYDIIKINAEVTCGGEIKDFSAKITRQ